MKTAEKIKAIEFKLQFMVLMMNTNRMEEANTSLQSAFTLLEELKSTVEASSLKLEAV